MLLGGLGLVMLGAVLLAEASLDGAIPIADLVAPFGNDYFLAAAVGVALLVFATLAVEFSGGVTQFEMPDAEGSVSVPTPGDDLDGSVTRWRATLPLVGSTSPREVRGRLRETAVEALCRTRRLDEADATAAVESGSWTDDPVAATFLARSGVTSSPSGWLGALARLEPPLRYRTRRTIDAIASLSHTDPSEGRG